MSKKELEQRVEERRHCMDQATAIFLRLLRKNEPVAFEDAAKCVTTPNWFDRRTFGAIPAGLHRDGVIAESGFRMSETAKHKYGIKRLWLLATPNEKGAAQ